LSEAGRISERRIDDAVARILTQKFRLGLFEQPYADTSGASEIGSGEHRAVAREAAAASQVLLKNSENLLPLKKSTVLEGIQQAGGEVASGTPRTIRSSRTAGA